MKLTNEIRDRIILKISAEKFGKQYELLALKERAFVDDIYNSIEGINKIKKLPIDWFANSLTFTVYFNGESSYQQLSEKKPLPYCIVNNGLKFPLDHALTKRKVQLKQERYELQLTEKELKTELHKVLYSVTTDKRLIEIWPEATKWLPSPSVVYLPANVDVNKLRLLMKPL